MGADTIIGMGKAICPLPLDVMLATIKQIPTAGSNKLAPAVISPDSGRFFAYLWSLACIMFGLAAFEEPGGRHLRGCSMGSGRRRRTDRKARLRLAMARGEVGSGMVPVREGCKASDVTAKSRDSKENGAA